nr:hypothetical protein [Tanacetum cinerariifolium]
MTTVTTITSTVDPTLVAKEKLVKLSPFSDGSSSAGGTNPTTSVFSDLTGSDFLVGVIREIENLKAQLLLREVEAAEAIRLQHNAILEKDWNALDVKVTDLEASTFDKLYTDFVEMALHLEDKFYPHLLTTIFGRRWLLTHGMELAIVNCLNSPEYLSAFGAAIGKAIEKGMQDELSVVITHGKEGRVLTDVAAYNPSAKLITFLLYNSSKM